MGHAGSSEMGRSDVIGSKPRITAKLAVLRVLEAGILAEWMSWECSHGTWRKHLTKAVKSSEKMALVSNRSHGAPSELFGS